MESAAIHVNFSSLKGKMKPMHALNNTPTVPYDQYGGKLFEKIKEAGIPYARFHDTGGRYGGARYIDIANIFPDFQKDENDPLSYDFTFTDVLLSETVKYGMKPFYRLGATIENDQHIKAYHIYPPEDFSKWARICEKIIRHYNEGWNHGFHFDIRYWEIWNEPDNEPDIRNNPMWKGTKEEYFSLYRITYGHLKKCFPDLRIGGYASCGFYALSNADCSQSAHSSPRTDYFIDFFLAFLKDIQKNQIGLDFFSWHSYADISDNVRYAQYARMQLNEYGYKDCEIFLDEWNTGISNRGTQKDAADILSFFCCMQNTPTDMCMYYDAQICSDYCGIFDPVKHDVFRAYYSFYIFNRLYQLKNQAECTVLGKNIYALAASDGEKHRMVVVNRSSDDTNIALHVYTEDNAENFLADTETIYRLDETHLFEHTEERGKCFSIPAYGIVLIEC